ncbi:unnamed protein product, partial [Staurois parvus]
MRSGHPAVKPQAVTAGCPHLGCRHWGARMAGETRCSEYTA